MTAIEESRRHVHALIDQLGPAQLTAVEGLLKTVLDPVAASLEQAPVEEEEITADLAAELDTAREAIERGEGISHEEILREFGVSSR